MATPDSVLSLSYSVCVIMLEPTANGREKKGNDFFLRRSLILCIMFIQVLQIF